MLLLVLSLSAYANPTSIVDVDIEALGQPSSQQQIAERVAAVIAHVRPDVKPCVPTLQMTSTDEIVAVVNREIDDAPEGYLDVIARVEIGLGVMPPGRSMRTSLEEMYGSALAGLFSPRLNTLYVQTGIPDEELEMVLTHELVHCQQHATWDLTQIGEILPGQSDYSQAGHLLVEGDAELTRLATQGDPSDLRADQWADIVSQWLAIPAEAPEQRVWIHEGVLGYSITAQVLTQLYTEQGWEAVDALYRDLPVSTEQLLHYDKLVSREPPIAVRIKAEQAQKVRPGVAIAYEDNLGEGRFIGMFMEVVEPNQARACAAGWGGDRMFLLDDGSPTPTVVGMTVWDSEAEAIQAESCLQAWFEQRLPHNATVQRKGERILYVTGVSTGVGKARKRAWAAFE